MILSDTLRVRAAAQCASSAGRRCCATSRRSTTRFRHPPRAAWPTRSAMRSKRAAPAEFPGGSRPATPQRHRHADVGARGFFIHPPGSPSLCSSRSLDAQLRRVEGGDRQRPPRSCSPEPSAPRISTSPQRADQHRLVQHVEAQAPAAQQASGPAARASAPASQPAALRASNQRPAASPHSSTPSQGSTGA